MSKNSGVEVIVAMLFIVSAIIVSGAIAFISSMMYLTDEWSIGQTVLGLLAGWVVGCGVALFAGD